MKLSIRISLILATLSTLISLIFAGVSYFYQLERSTKQNEALVLQLAQGAERATAIAGYIQDTELANEIIAGIANNDLISDVQIFLADGSFFAGSASVSVQLSQAIKVELFNPFVAEEILGELFVFPDNKFILSNAKASSLQIALLLMGLSFITALGVAVVVRNKLTNPLRHLADEFLKVDVSQANKLYKVDIDYKHRDEIGLLIKKVNSLISALQRQFLSEHELRKETEELQKRFRLLFEQSTAGIGLLELNGQVNISNPAMNQLFGQSMEGQFLPQYFATPSILQDHIESIQDGNSFSQIGVDLVSYRGNRKRYLHCLLSTIKDSREDSREDSEHLIEVMLYDVTLRKELERKTRYEADHDSLTGLLNRRAGAIALQNQLEESATSRRNFAILMIDLDQFKPINDNHGHDIGDVVLKKVSDRLMTTSSAFRSTCVRWGGDEFLLGFQLDSNDDLAGLSESLLASLKQSIAVTNDLTVSVGASIGGVCVDAIYDQQNDLDSMIKKADALMYRIKANGKNSFEIQDL